jgi:hypothetical protein
MFAASQDTYLQCLTNFETYAESIWHTASYTGASADAGYWGDGGSSGNGGIRGNSGVAVAYATLVLAQPASARNATRLNHLRQALNYDTATHVTGTNKCVDGRNWGWSSASSTDWQTSLWAGSMGLACLLMQTNLPAAVVADVQRVVASEADHRAGIAPASGYIGDTKAEENAWQGNILALAAAWMSTHGNGSNWLWAAKRYCANSYTVANTNGDPLAAWISTVTLYPSFALENHGFYHPTYEMAAGMSLGDSLLMAKLSNRGIAAQLQPFAEHNVMATWTNNLNAMVLAAGDFAYPAGLDWEVHDYEQNSYIAWLAVHFNDPLARWTDDKLAQLCRYRQVVNGDGSFVGPSGGGFYREAVEARRTAIAWLHWANADFPSGAQTPPPPATVQYSDVKIIAQRSASSFVSLSYGSRIMAMIEAAPVSIPTNVYVATPLLPGVIGMGALGAPTAATLVSFGTGANGFEAELHVVNGANGTTEVYFKSTGDSIAIVEVPFPASSGTGSGSGSFNTGIENDPLCGGTRLLEWTGGSAINTSRSGSARNVSNNWVCVSGRYGLAAGPAGYFNYTAATGYNRLGAAEDTLAFIPQDPLGPRYAVWFPGKTAADTASNAARISWTVSGTNATLSFPGAGSTQQVSAVLFTGMPYPAYRLPISSIAASSFQPAFPPTNAVDQNTSTFWVSYGTNAGQGPTTAHPERLTVAFPRRAALSKFSIAPRTTNGGYGPKDLQLLLDGVPIYSGRMAASASLDVTLSPPAYASNAQLLITSSYDPSFPSNSRNVQVVELTFYERAPPDTFGDWALRHFSDAQVADPTVSCPVADPDQDGVLNLLEFATGCDPLLSDAANAKVQTGSAPPGQFALRFRERKNLVGLSRQFLISNDLVTWSAVTPLTVSAVQDFGEAALLEAVFSALSTRSFFRISYVQ